MTDVVFVRLGRALAVISCNWVTHPVAAQSTLEHRFTVSASGGVQTAVTTQTDVAQSIVNLEVASIRGTRTLGRYAILDGCASAFVWKTLGVGLFVSRAEGETVARVEAEVPHPFFFDFDRTVTASVPNLRHRELIYHLSAQLVIPLGAAARLTVLGGPSRFNASQEVVSGIETAELGFPFDVVEVVGSHIQRRSVKSWGYHVGVDVAYFGLGKIGPLRRSAVFDHVGVGVLVRYSRSQPAVELLGVPQPDLRLGALHVGGGLRSSF